MKESILKFLTFALGSLSAAFFALITTPIITRLILPEEYGYYSLFLLLSNIFIMIALFGVDQAITRYYFEVNISKLYFQIYKILNFSFIIASLIMLAVIYIFDFTYFKNIYMVIAFIIFMISSVNFRIQNLKLRMEQKALLYSSMIFSSKLFEFAVTLFMLYLFSNSAKTLITSIVISMLLSNVFNYYMNKNFISYNNDNTNNIEIIEIVQYSYPLMISGVFTMVFQVSDKLLLNIFSSSHEFGIYTASFKLAALLTIIQQAFSLFWTPFIMKKYTDGENIKLILKDIYLVMTIFLFIVYIILILLKSVLILFLGEEYREGENFLPFFYFLPIMYTLSEITIVGVYFKAKTKKILYVSVTTLIISVVASAALSYFYNGIGSSISLAITYTCFFILRTMIGLKEFYFDINKLSIIFLISSMFVIGSLSIIVNNLLVIIIVSLFLIIVYLIINIKDIIILINKFKRRN